MDTESHERKESLLAEYEANVELWKHDDSMREQRSGNFLTVNSILLATLAAVLVLKASFLYLGIIAILFSVFGVVLCRVWHHVLARNADYNKFRRIQLCSIEKQLPGLTTFANIFSAFNKGAEIEFPILKERFEVAEKNSSTMTEGRLPLLIGCFWALVGVVGFLLIIGQTMDFKESNFVRSRISGSNFDQSLFRNASFRGAIFTGADLRVADFSQAVIDDKTQFPLLKPRANK